MGNQIIKQPDGRFAIYSSVVDGFTATDCSRQDIIDYWGTQERDRLTESVNRICDRLDEGLNHYAQFQMTWEEAIAEHERRHGPLNSAAPGAPEEQKK